MDGCLVLVFVLTTDSRAGERHVMQKSSVVLL